MSLEMAKPLSKNAYIKLALRHSPGNQANNKKEKKRNLSRLFLYIIMPLTKCYKYPFAIKII